MKWWTWLWIVLLAFLTIGGAWDDYRDRRRPLVIVLALASGLICVASVLAFAGQGYAATLGRWLLPCSILAGAQLAIEVARDVRTLSPDPELSARENRVTRAIGVLTVVLVFGAAVLVGITTGVQRW